MNFNEFLIEVDRAAKVITERHPVPEFPDGELADAEIAIFHNVRAKQWLRQAAESRTQAAILEKAGKTKVARAMYEWAEARQQVALNTANTWPIA